MLVKDAIVSNEAPNETFTLNLGPQHPATHGVLRVKMVMDGEYIVKAEPVCGYIHRMQEKMGENRTYAQFLPNTSRIDYLSAMTYTHAFVGAVERAAPDISAGFDPMRSLALPPSPGGNVWMVTQIAAPLAKSSLWQMLLDPKTFSP